MKKIFKIAAWLYDQQVSGVSGIFSVERGWQLNEIMLEKSSLDEIFAQLSKRYTK